MSLDIHTVEQIICDLCNDEIKSYPYITCLHCSDIEFCILCYQKHNHSRSHLVCIVNKYDQREQVIKLRAFLSEEQQQEQQQHPPHNNRNAVCIHKSILIKKQHNNDTLQ